MLLNQITQLSWIYDLYRLGQSAAQAGENTPGIYQQILEYIVDGFGAKSGSLALLDQNGGSLAIVAGIDLPQGIVGSKVAPDEGVLGWVVQNGLALLLNGDASNDPRFQRHREARGSAAANSAICWPLKIEDRIIGCVNVNRSINGIASMSLPDDMPPFTEADLQQGTVILDMVSLILANMQLLINQKRQLEEMQKLNYQLEDAHNQLLQSEKMASIGQLAAGVAHEINNPIGYVYSNMGMLEKYVRDAFSMIEQYEQAEGMIADEVVRTQLKAAREKLDIEFLKNDLRALMNESKDGITRVKNIVQNLKDFSHVDAANEWHFADLHSGLDSTLNIVNNEIKYKANVIKEYGDIPEIECLPSQLNQVFMNLLVNAAHAIEERGAITIRTGCQENGIWVEIADTGNGIAPENLKKIFDPFFTTKPVGKGTGLGLSLSYGIIQKHHGYIEAQSEIGKGTRFKVWLPISQPQGEQA